MTAEQALWGHVANIFQIKNNAWSGEIPPNDLPLLNLSTSLALLLPANFPLLACNTR